MTVKFMSTKERCLHCGEKLTEIEKRLFVETKEGKKQFCNAFCLDQWFSNCSDLK